MFKSDSQRVAFLLCVGFSVLGGMRELRYCVAHTLTGRYTISGNRICLTIRIKSFRFVKSF
ncbi:DUF3265 domain-containing protein [Vibrio harveyi]|nr:DUF3265 domain-containing protein [Vibrio harveyi]